MATTEDMAPEAAASPKPGGNGTRGARSRSRARSREDRLEDQIARLQDDLKAIAGTIAAMADERVGEARGAARSEVRNLARTGQQAVEDIQDEFGHIERQVKDTIRKRPLTAVAGAVAVGFVLALLTR